MADLTERLAAKLHPWLTHFTGGRYVREALVPDLLPLLLSEPELVAGLPDAVRLSVLTPRERVALRLGTMAMNEVEAKALTPEVPRG